MKHGIDRSWLGIALVILLAGTSMPAEAQWRGAQTCGKGTMCMFPVKMVCNTQISHKIELEGVGGVHKIFERTAVNILNIQDTTVRFEYKIVWPKTRDFEGRIFDFVTVALPPNGALLLDCADYLRIDPARLDENLDTGTPNEGFLVIESPLDLQVVAVYQKRNVKEGKGEKTYKHFYYAAKKNVYGPGDVPKEEETVVKQLPLGAEELPRGPEGAGEPKTATETGETVTIPIDHSPDPEVDAAGLGIGVGYGIGHGLGVGIGTGISIDVEYVEPFVLPQRRGKSGR